ncbi:protein kinase domain-containing protein [Streptomyces puniciscabiei]
MGVVRRAVDEVLGREVAVKELRTCTDAAGPELSELRLRMQREARAAARVRHPGVVAVHDVTEVDGRPLIVTELIDGPSLDDVLRERGTLDPYEAARVGAEVLDALAAARRAGVLHRDVKPGNILLDRSGRVVLTVATMDDPGDGSVTRLTRSGELVGSLDHVAPERAQGAEPGAPADVWAVGATLYAAVEGASPFRRTSTYSTLTAIVSEPLPEPHRAGPLAPVLRRLMDKRPDARPDAEEAREALRAAARTRTPDVPTATLRPTPPVAPETTEATGHGAPSSAPHPGFGLLQPGAAGPSGPAAACAPGGSAAVHGPGAPAAALGPVAPAGSPVAPVPSSAGAPGVPTGPGPALPAGASTGPMSTPLGAPPPQGPRPARRRGRRRRPCAGRGHRGPGARPGSAEDRLGTGRVPLPGRDHETGRHRVVHAAEEVARGRREARRTQRDGGGRGSPRAVLACLRPGVPHDTGRTTLHHPGPDRQFGDHLRSGGSLPVPRRRQVRLRGLAHRHVLHGLRHRGRDPERGHELLLLPGESGPPGDLRPVDERVVGQDRRRQRQHRRLRQ